MMVYKLCFQGFFNPPDLQIRDTPREEHGACPAKNTGHAYGVSE
jgi:hypothetical protein